MNDFFKNAFRRLIPIFACALLIVVQSACSSKLHLVAWNMEHLAENNGAGCVPRNDSDYANLRHFAENLNADVVALQEVESAKAVARVFPEEDWHIIVSDRPSSGSYECYGNGQPSTQQRVAMVIRKGLKYQEAGTFKELALNRRGLRYGVVVKLIHRSDTLEVMSVHLKSGCFVEDYSQSEKSACETFEQQVPVLDDWIETRLKNEQPFVVLGDFNHRIANPENKFWQVLTEMDGQMVVISNSMQNLKSCHPRYPEPIDHILMGAGAEEYYVPGSEAVYYFSENPESMTEETMLSDHCPIGVTLERK